MNSTDALVLAPLPLLQPFWDALRARSALLSPVGCACVALLLHLCFSTPFLLLELLGARSTLLRRYRIAGREYGARETADRWFECLARITCLYVAAVLPLAALVQLFGGDTGHDRYREAPPLFRALSQIFACLLLFDTLFFVSHYAIHRNQWLFQKIHRSHHLHRDTFALAAQDSGVTELLLQQMLAICSARLVGCHPMSEILFHFLNIWLAVEDHCGYDFPWATHRLLPCFGGPPFHHAHHLHFRGNYAPYFRHWDLIFRTSLPPAPTHKGNSSTSVFDHQALSNYSVGSCKNFHSTAVRRRLLKGQNI
ncbi:cholesterol 25-hydroxylase-like protein [Hoplias malabaricus]|uniref:cholesterol 25-hydroxylase-like protein n=1 Tax=Hoplias malabaricus TaxID=27720 RepID=UPI00346190F4